MSRFLQRCNKYMHDFQKNTPSPDDFGHTTMLLQLETNADVMGRVVLLWSCVIVSSPYLS